MRRLRTPLTEAIAESSTRHEPPPPDRVADLSAAGASSVGKSSLLLRFTDELFLSPDETSGKPCSARFGLSAMQLILLHRIASHHRSRLQGQGYRATGTKMEVEHLGSSHLPCTRRSNFGAELTSLALFKGHGWPRAFPHPHLFLLPWRTRSDPRVRHHRPRHL